MSAHSPGLRPRTSPSDRRGQSRASGRRRPATADTLLLLAHQLLAVAGVGVAGYLTDVHYTGLHLVCAFGRGCETVQTSIYASLLGVPVALLGLISYVSILACVSRRDGRWLFWSFSISLIAWGFSLYLTYREIFTIHAICSWCVSSALILTLLVIVGTVRAWRAAT